MMLDEPTTAERCAARDLPIEEIAASFVSRRHGARRFRYVQAARDNHRGLATLVSWWLDRGERVSEPLQAELALHRRRNERYRRVLDQLRTAAPAAVPAKGFSAAAWYPRALTREMADIDLVAPDAEAVWTCGSTLFADGWEPHMSYLWRVGGRTHVQLVMKRPAEHPDLTARDRVEIITASYEGDRIRVPPRCRRWPAGAEPSVADCMLWLLQELRDQPPRMRDMFDLAVFRACATPADTTSIAEHVAEYGAHRPLRTLISGARRHLPGVTDWLTGIQSEAMRRSTVRTRLPWWTRRSPAATLLAAAGEATRSRREFVSRAATTALISAQR
ncbi:MAG: hypothetical protein ACRDXX_10000, partial [Stackebrandtia sp.]